MVTPVLVSLSDIFPVLLNLEGKGGKCVRELKHKSPVIAVYSRAPNVASD